MPKRLADPIGQLEPERLSGFLLEDRRSRYDVLALMGYPKEHWPQLASTYPLERLNKEIKRRSRVAGIFPNNAATVRPVNTLLAEQTDEWQVTHRYMSQGSLARVISLDNAQALPEGQQAA
jgi:transposase-like protein